MKYLPIIILILSIFGCKSNPSLQLYAQPSLQPSINPSVKPTSNPSLHPSVKPTLHPSSQPSSQPSSYNFLIMDDNNLFMIIGITGGITIILFVFYKCNKSEIDKKNGPLANKQCITRDLDEKDFLL